MRILYLTPGITHQPDSLPDHMTHALARMAQREGHQVHVVTPPVLGTDQQAVNDDSPVVQDQQYLVRGVSVTRLAPLPAAGASARFWKWVRDQKFDLLHGVFAHPADWPFDPDAGPLPPLVITLTGLPTAESGATAVAGRQWLRRADLCAVPSDYAASRWRTVVPDLSFRVMPLGIDLLALIQARQLHTRDTTLHSPPTLLCVGTFDQLSGLLDVLKAFSTLDRADLRLNLVGGIDGHSAYGQSVTAALRSAPRILHTSKQHPTTLTAIAQPFDVVCLPDLGSQPPLLLAQECAALGIPCLINRSGPHAGAFDQHEGLHCVPSTDPAAWAMSMERWVNSFDRSQPPLMNSVVPMRIEEVAFLYEGLYRGLIFDRTQYRIGRGL
jgi:glycosyltransferase involved in cell wall biosynthesis